MSPVSTDDTPVGLSPPDITEPPGATTLPPGLPPPRDAAAGEEAAAAVGDDTLPPDSSGTMPPRSVSSELNAHLQLVLSTANHSRVAYQALQEGWLPRLQRALEEAGGDGLDAWLHQVVAGLPAAAEDPLWGRLDEAMRALRASKDLAHFERLAQGIPELVNEGLAAQPVRPLSLAALQTLLNDQLSLERLLHILLSDDSELTGRLHDLTSQLERMRPDDVQRSGLLAERGVVEGELQRRQRFLPSG